MLSSIFEQQDSGVSANKAGNYIKYNNTIMLAL